MRSQFQIVLTAAASVVAASTMDFFNWKSITPKPDLEYHSCYDEFKCARLLLLLDWLDKDCNKTIALAVIKKDAVVDIDHPAYAGPVLSNPGGPGASGVMSLPGTVALQRHTVDTPGKKHFEYVSFDPRGIGHSTPKVDCYPSNPLARTAATIKARGSGGLDGGPASLPYGLAMSEVEGKRCAAFNRHLLQHVGTPSVARDMLALVEKIDEYNKRNSKKAHGRLELRTATDNLPRLQYLGFSYGTVLGTYFASMFPGRVGRLALDGVSDIDDYANGDGWLTNTVEADQMVDNFFKGCFNAGHKTCPLRFKDDKSASDISKRFWSWVDSLDETPTLAVKGDQSAVIQSGDIRKILFDALYKPLKRFKDTAARFADVMRGNTGALFDFISAQTDDSLEEACFTSKLSGLRVQYLDPDACSAVLCGDGADMHGRNMTFWRDYMARQLAQSSLVGAHWTSIAVSCAHWPAQAKWKFHGPFTTPRPSVNDPDCPAAPLLLLSNRLDPVTPLSAARKVASKYPGAGLLVQETMGHCVLSTGPVTDCTRDIVRRCFDKGVVPDKETTCDAACDPWGPKCDFKTSSFGTGLNSGDGFRHHSRRFPLLL